LQGNGGKKKGGGCHDGAKKKIRKKNHCKSLPNNYEEEKRGKGRDTLPYRTRKKCDCHPTQILIRGGEGTISRGGGKRRGWSAISPLSKEEKEVAKKEQGRSDTPQSYPADHVERKTPRKEGKEGRCSIRINFLNQGGRGSANKQGKEKKSVDGAGFIFQSEKGEHAALANMDIRLFRATKKRTNNIESVLEGGDKVFEKNSNI